MARALIPNSTQIPDVILDQWMADLSGAELKVVLYTAGDLIKAYVVALFAKAKSAPSYIENNF